MSLILKKIKKEIKIKHSKITCLINKKSQNDLQWWFSDRKPLQLVMLVKNEIWL